MLENFLPAAPNAKGGDDNKRGNDNQENGNVDHNVDQQSIPSEQNTSKPEGGKPSLDNMGDFKYLTAFYVVITWCTYMMDGMDFFARLKDGPHFLSWNTSIRLWNACHER